MNNNHLLSPVQLPTTNSSGASRYGLFLEGGDLIGLPKAYVGMVEDSWTLINT